MVEHGQLLRLGLGEDAIQWRIAAGRLHPVHRGVYAVGHRRLTVAGRRLAAVLACGDGAVLSHHTAADVWGIRRSASPRIHVAIPTRSGRDRPGIVVHRPRRLPPTDRTTCEGLPVTTVARTLIDLTRHLDGPGLRKAVERSVERRLFDGALLDGRAPRRLRRAIDEADPAPLDSDLESDFLALCRAHGIPRPRTNVNIGGYAIDFLWPEQRLIVETDGWQSHRTRRAFENDRRRDAELARAGFTTLRFTHRAVTEDDATVAGVVLSRL